MPILSSKLHLSEIAPTVIQSEIRAMSVECDRVGGINLAQGICDTELPGVVAEGAVEAIHDGFNIYTRLDGIAPLREAIAAKLKSYNQLDVDPERKCWSQMARRERCMLRCSLFSIRAMR